MRNSKHEINPKGMGSVPDTLKRKAGFSLLFSLWAAVFLFLADALYGGCFLKLQSYSWASTYYHFLTLHIGFSWTILAFFALYSAFILALAGILLGIASLLRGGFFYKLCGLLSLGLCGTVIWYSAPGILLTSAGMLLLILSPHTQSARDRFFAAFMLLSPLSALLLCRLTVRKPPKAANVTNDP